MGWHINVVQNDVVINKKIAYELYEKANDCRWDFGEPVSDYDILEYGVAYKEKDGEYKLYFDSDHMEHMDYVWNEDVLKILKKHKVKGDICFSSDDGDNAGQSWGYRFDGKGGMVRLEGVRTFLPVQPPKKKASTKKRAARKK